jgi:hypothetical protein
LLHALFPETKPFYSVFFFLNLKPLAILSRFLLISMSLSNLISQFYLQVGNYIHRISLIGVIISH